MVNSRVIEGGLAAAAVLITLGAVLGKLNPFQILMLSLLETPVFVLNVYLGYSILGCVDVGKFKNWSQKLRVKCLKFAAFLLISISNSFINFPGGAIFVHAFGAYFGLAVSMVHRRRKTESSEHLEGSRYTTDIFAMVFFIYIVLFSNININCKSLK